MPPLMLSDMRFVYAGHTMAGEEPARYKLLRKEWKETPRVFMDRLASLEKDWLLQQSKQRREEKRDASGPDEGTGVAEALARKWLESHETESGSGS